MNIIKPLKGGIVYSWQYVSKGLYKKNSAVEDNDLSVQMLIESSFCFTRGSYSLHDVLIKKVNDPHNPAVNLYYIEQANNQTAPRQRDRVGSIQILENSEIWVRWGNCSEYIKQLNSFELRTLLGILENAELPIENDLIQNFSSKKRKSNVYKTS